MAKRIRVGLALFIVLLLAGCPASFMKDANGDGKYEITWIGDSTSLWIPEIGWYGAPYLLQGMLDATHPQWEVVPYPKEGATVTHYERWWDFERLLNQSVRDGVFADVYVFAGGTNDALLQREPQDLFRRLMYLRSLVDSLPGNPATIVALSPNFVPPASDTKPWGNQYSMSYNAWIPLEFGSNVTLDFWSPTLSPEDHTSEGVHFSLQGQCKRAAEAFQLFFPGESAPSTADCPV